MTLSHPERILFTVTGMRGLLMKEIEWCYFLRFECKHVLPVALHIHNRPVLRFGFVPSLVELSDGRRAVIGPLTLGVCVMDNQPEAFATPIGRPLEHLEVFVGIAEGSDRTPSDVQMDTHGFACLVVNKVHFA